MKNGSRFIVLGMVASLVGLVASPASAATTRWVNDDAGAYLAPGVDCTVAGYSTIGAAVSASASGDTIMVCAGTYTEPAIDVPVGISLQGPNFGISPNGGVRVAEAIIVGTGPPDIRISTTEPVTIDGFTFRDGPATFIDSYTVGNNPTISHNVFTNQVDAFYFNQPNLLTFEDNHLHDLFDCGPCDGILAAGNWNGTTGTTVSIKDNVWENAGGPGMNLSNVSGTLSGNTFDGYTYYAALLANGTNLDVTGNHFEDGLNPNPGLTQTWGAGIRFYTPSAGFGARMTDNTFTNNYVGIGVRGTGTDITGMDVYANNNNFVGNTAAGIRHEGSGTFDAECNWWGADDGPAPTGSGDAVFGPVDYEPWLIAPAPGGACAGPTAMQRKEAVRDSLEAKQLTADEKDAKRIAKAIEHLDKSLNPDYWDGPNQLDPKDGDKVFKEEQKAVHELMKVEITDVDAERDELVAIDKELAQTEYDDAVAAGGEQKDLDKSQEELDKGDAEALAGNDDKAIEHYRKGWEHAVKAQQ